eukprot:493679_1
MNVQTINVAENKDEYDVAMLVYGYIRNIETALASAHIHDVVISLCLIYSINEYWYKCGSAVTVSNKKQTITKRGQRPITYETCYGKICIPSNTTNHNIYHWKIKINNNPNSNRICIGIDNAKCKWINGRIDWIAGHSRAYYLYDSCGRMITWNNQNHVHTRQSYQNNDIIDMILSMKDGKLYFYKNDKKLNHTFDVLQEKHFYYRLSVSVIAPASVTLLQFRINPIKFV